MAVQKRDYATIFIGLGGTGKAAILKIKEKFRERLVCDPVTKNPRRTAFIVLDGDSANCGIGQPIEQGEYVNLYVPNLEDTLDPANRANLEPYEKTWISPDLTAEGIGAGAGAIRQIGRFQLFRHVDEFHRKFENALNQTIFIKADAADNNKKVDVVICAGLCGGTGSGTFLDAAYLVKQWLSDKFAGAPYKLNTYGYLMMPEVYATDSTVNKVGADPVDGPKMKAGAYAALKELDYWMGPNDKMDFVQVYGSGIQANWKNLGKPFSLVFLMDARRLHGSTIEMAYSTNLDKIAEMMLYCYAEEKGADFTFDSFMANVHNKMLSIYHGNGRTVPTNYAFASLGVSTTESVDEMVQNYEITKVLERVVAVPVVNDQNVPCAPDAKIEAGVGATVIPKPFYEKEANRKSLYNNLFGLELIFDHRSEDQSFEKWFIGENDAFTHSNGYSPMSEPSLDEIRNQHDQESLFAKHIRKAVGSTAQEGKWMYRAQEKATVLYDTERAKFEDAAKSAIKNPAIGPASWLWMVQNSLMNRLQKNVEYLEGAAQKASGAAVTAEEQAQAKSNELYKLNFIDFGLAKTIGKNSHISSYQQYERVAAQNQRAYCYYSQRALGAQKLLDYVRTYGDALKTILDLLNRIAAESSERLAQNDDEPRLVSLEQLTAYFDKHEDEQEMAFATARDNIWNALADASIEATNTGSANTAVELQQKKIKLRKTVKSFLDNVTSTLQLNKLDWIISALEPNPEKQNEYVAKEFCPVLDQVAEPMLPEDLTNPLVPIQIAPHNYISVPENADTLISGFNMYANGRDNIGIKQSEITDRVLWLNIRGGVSAATILQLDKLHTEYEKILNAGSKKLSAGLHLVDRMPATNLTDEWEANYSWTMLPNLLPDELFQKRPTMSARSKNNWAEVQKIFTQACAAQMVRDDAVNQTFTVDYMKNDMNPKRFEDSVNKIKNNSDLSPEERIEALSKMWADLMTTSPALEYRQFFNATLSKQGVEPLSDNASTEEEEAYNKKCNEVKNLLCAYLVLLHPQLLRRLQNQLTNMQCYTAAIDELKHEIGVGDINAGVFKNFARLIALGKIVMDQNTYVLKTEGEDGEEEFELFPFSLTEMGFEDIDDLTVIRGIKGYAEACFLLQYVNRGGLTSLKKNVSAQLEFALNRTLGNMRAFGKNAKALCEEYKTICEAKHAEYSKHVGTKKALSGIESNEMLNDASDFVRNQLKKPYEAMCKVLLDDIVATMS